MLAFVILGIPRLYLPTRLCSRVTTSRRVRKLLLLIAECQRFITRRLHYTGAAAPRVHLHPLISSNWSWEIFPLKSNKTAKIFAKKWQNVNHNLNKNSHFQPKLGTFLGLVGRSPKLEKFLYPSCESPNDNPEMGQRTKFQLLVKKIYLSVSLSISFLAYCDRVLILNGRFLEFSWLLSFDSDINCFWATFSELILGLELQISSCMHLPSSFLDHR